MTCDFTSYSTVFQSYQDDERTRAPFTIEKITPRAGLELETARSVGKRLTH